MRRMKRRDLTNDQREQIDCEVEEELRSHPYLTTSWEVITAVIFFGAPAFASLVLVLNGGRYDEGVVTQAGLIALTAWGGYYWLTKRDYYNKWSKEWESRMPLQMDTPSFEPDTHLKEVQSGGTKKSMNDV